MTVRLIGSPRTTSETARLAKNQQIKQSIKATKARRKTQVCSTFDLKIVTNKLSRTQREALTRVFLEAKWLWNECIASGNPFTYQPASSVTVKTHSGTIEQREYHVLGSQMKQALVKTIRANIKTLATLKQQGKKVGAVGFTKAVTALGLPQPDTTYKIRGQKARIQNIPGWVRVRGVRQLEGWEQAKANLTSEADGWHLHVTCYMNKEEYAQRREAKNLAPQANTIIGIDMGVKTSITCSDGTEYNVMIGETDRLKRKQRTLRHKHKGSNNYRRTKHAINRVYQRQQHKLNNAANQIVAKLLRNQIVFMQDEQIKQWQRRYGKTIQHSVLGRVKTRLIRHHEQTVVLSKWEATTQLCPICHEKTRTPLTQHTYRCEYCNYTAPRDIKAAQSMVWIGQTEYAQQIPLERGEYKPAENASESYATNLRMFSTRSVKQETVAVSTQR
ncbi:hypothetical protein GCM10007377_15400 [Galliscardovia ingluviei]|uniref:Transposase n=1 Tax=Galliscardovia ingluviei TaxID=1769422 RepID=A0A8J3AKN8_9BIFI|nr:RNA-guided endonuclease TnpB family protein [Galliscardovia ingluviei]GGI15338.1 hypothetical protein GCM10007377_15400 [Galliscardovia ingluviei]